MYQHLVASTPIVRATENEQKIKSTKSGGAGTDGRERDVSFPQTPARGLGSFPVHPVPDRAPRLTHFYRRSRSTLTKTLWREEIWC